MEKITAKLRAFGKVRDGVVVKIARTRAQIQWVTPQGKTREVWAVPVATEAELEGDNGIGKCWLSKPLAKRGENVEIKRDPNAIPARKAAPITVYTPGSARAKRQEVLVQETATRAKLKECKGCNALRAEANRLANEAEDLFGQVIDEVEAERGKPSSKRITFTEKEDE